MTQTADNEPNASQQQHKKQQHRLHLNNETEWEKKVQRKIFNRTYSRFN